MIKAAFFDIDGTLLDPITHTIPQSSIATVNRLQKKGIKVFVASGRQYSDLHLIKGLNAMHWDGYVCCNGAAVYDAEGKLLGAKYFQRHQVDGLLKKCETEGLTVFLRCGDFGFAPLGIDRYMIEAHSFFDEPLPSYVYPYQGEDILMALLYAGMEYDFRSVNSIAGLQAFPNRSTYADVCLAEISKKVGLEIVAEKFGYRKEELLAFGDQNNDLEMLRYAGIGVAMGNASKEAKEAADYVTLDCDQNGIEYACEQLGLL